MARHLSPNDVVPRLRNDLNVTSPPVGTGAEVIRVGPAGTGDRVVLHGFEFSIALMLDGKRTVQDVVTNCEKLGLPIELGGLENFLRQLKSYGLLDPADAETGATIRIRPSWDAAVRSLFQSALHDARSGDIADAREDLRQLLSLAPATPEALRLLAWLEANGTGPEHDKTFQDLLADVQKSWGEDRQAAITIRARAVVVRRKWPIIAAAGIAALLVAGSFIPLPRSLAASAELTPLSRVPVVTPRDGIVDTVAVQAGDHVEKGDVLFTWNTEEVEAQVSDARDRLEAARAPVREALGRTPAGAAAWARFKTAQFELMTARAGLQDATDLTASGEPPDDLSVNEQRVTDAEAEFDEAREGLDSLVPYESADAVHLRTLSDEVQALEDQAGDREVLAPEAGTVSDLFLRDNETVAAGQTIAQIDDLSRMKMIVVVTPRDAATVRIGEPMTVRFGGQQLATTIEAVSGYELAGEVANPNGTLKIESMPVQLKLAPKSIIARLRGVRDVRVDPVRSAG